MRHELDPLAWMEQLIKQNEAIIVYWGLRWMFVFFFAAADALVFPVIWEGFPNVMVLLQSWVLEPVN